MDKERINYSQCWEDPRILTEALSVRPDDCVLSITSGGDNTLALLLAGPRNIVSIDLNPTQNYLLELKIAAVKSLSYYEYLEFLGVRQSRHRAMLFKKIRDKLPLTAETWWSNHPALINLGAIHCGRFERFTMWFVHYLLPFAHSRKTTSKLLSCHDIDEQRVFYRDQWDSKRWKFFFGLASSRLMLKKYARAHGMFAHTEKRTVAEVYRKRFQRTVTSVSINDNFFLRYSLTGTYGESLPPYLEEKNYTRLRNTPDSALSVVTKDLMGYLRSIPTGTFSKYNLSDIFEALSSSENDALWQEIVRTAKDGAVVAYWNNLVERSYPARLSAHIQTDDARNATLQAKERVFFYDSFHVHTILK